MKTPDAIAILVGICAGVGLAAYGIICFSF